MENFMKWKMMGGPKIIKKGVVPHKFACQKNRNLTTFNVPIRKGAEKRKRMDDVQEALDSSSNKASLNLSPNISIEPEVEENQPVSSFADLEPKNKDVGVTAKPHFRSKHTQTKFENLFHNVATSPFVIEKKVSTSEPFKRKIVFSSSDCSESETSTHSEYIAMSQKGCEENSSSSDAIEKIVPTGKDFLKLALEHTLHLIYRNPKRYIGLNESCMYVINLLAKHTLVEEKNIFLTLQKIKLGQTFSELGDAYGVSESSANRIFCSTLPLVSSLLKELIVWPSADKIKTQLPFPFRARYSNVECIIDCLEIEIQKPRDAVKQALTWSEYKKTNTIKYLISSTPDGIINFISRGYGGRTSDAVIVEDCGFLDKLRPGTGVMADRGFKHIEKFIVEKKCILIRPPSVSAGQKLHKFEVLRTKRIASLRIHIERVIRRVREYRLLRPHSCVNLKMVPIMDLVIITACGLINLQRPIIK